VPFIQQHHARIIDIHLNDKKRARSLGGDVTSNTLNNYPWGQGDTPIREVVQLLARERYDIPVNIEFEYGCRTTGDAVSEIRRCYGYIRDSLQRV
jgi:sugar phosphate isomerase/epimerase